MQERGDIRAARRGIKIAFDHAHCPSSCVWLYVLVVMCVHSVLVNVCPGPERCVGPSRRRPSSGASHVCGFSSASPAGESPRQGSLAEDVLAAVSCLQRLVALRSLSSCTAERVEKGHWGFFPEDGIDGRCLLTQHACVRLQQPVLAPRPGCFLDPIATSCREARCTGLRLRSQEFLSHSSSRTWRGIIFERRPFQGERAGGQPQNGMRRQTISWPPSWRLGRGRFASCPPASRAGKVMGIRGGPWGPR